MIEIVKTIVVKDKEIDEGVLSFEESHISSKPGLSMSKASKYNSFIIRAENSRGDFMPNMNETESKVVQQKPSMVNKNIHLKLNHIIQCTRYKAK